MAKKTTTKTKTLNWPRLSEARVIQENQKLLVQARDRVRKYNKKYGTDYKINLPNGAKLTDRDLHTVLEQITTKNIKKIEADKTKPLSDINIKQHYSVNGVELTREQYLEMRDLQKKANALRGKTFDGKDYYKPYFTNIKGYQKYVARLRKVSTKAGYLQSIARGLQTFKASLLDHLEDIRNITTDADKLKEVVQIILWVESMCNTYTRLDRLYKFFKNAGYTGEQMARMFFDSDTDRNKWELGEDEEILALLKKFKKQTGWTRQGRLTKLERTIPVDL